MFPSPIFVSSDPRVARAPRICPRHLEFGVHSVSLERSGRENLFSSVADLPTHRLTRSRASGATTGDAPRARRSAPHLLDIDQARRRPLRRITLSARLRRQRDTHGSLLPRRDVPARLRQRCHDARGPRPRASRLGLRARSPRGRLTRASLPHVFRTITSPRLGLRPRRRRPLPRRHLRRERHRPRGGQGHAQVAEVWTWLNYEKKMQTVDSAEAVAMMKKGAVFLDVRFEPDYEKWSVPGSVHVPYVTGGVLAKLRLPGFKKKNVDFVSQVEAAIPNKKTKIILACIWGGSLVREPPKNRGLTDDTKGAGEPSGERLSSIRLGTPTCTTCTEA